MLCRQRFGTMVNLLVVIVATFLALQSCAMQNLPRTLPDIGRVLGAQLSAKAVIEPVTHLVRWSDFGAPHPGTVVTVESEEDAIITVRSQATQGSRLTGLSFAIASLTM